MGGGGARFSGVAPGGGGVVAQGVRGPVAGGWTGGNRSAAYAGGNWSGGNWSGYRHHRRGGFYPGLVAGALVGGALANSYAYYGDPYGYYDDYYDYPYAASYYDDYGYGDDGCYIVRKRVWTPYGWTFRRVQVCS